MSLQFGVTCIILILFLQNIMSYPLHLEHVFLTTLTFHLYTWYQVRWQINKLEHVESQNKPKQQSEKY